MGTISNVDVEFQKFGLGAPPRTNIADHIILLSQTLSIDKLPNVNMLVGNIEAKQSNNAIGNDEQVGFFVFYV